MSESSDKKLYTTTSFFTLLRRFMGKDCKEEASGVHTKASDVLKESEVGVPLKQINCFKWHLLCREQRLSSE